MTRNETIKAAYDYYANRKDISYEEKERFFENEIEALESIVRSERIALKQAINNSNADEDELQLHRDLMQLARHDINYATLKLRDLAQQQRAIRMS